MVMFNGITPEVIGVVDDIHLVDARTPSRPLALLAAEHFPDSERDLLVRTATDPAAIAGPLRAVVSDIAPGTPLYRVALLRDVVSGTLAVDRFTTLLIGVFAAAALVLAAIGIFGVFSADTHRRRREIGLRLALGGSAMSVVWLLVQRAMRRAATGVVAGLLLAGALGQGMRSLFFGVSAVDPASMATVAAGMAALTVAATLIPAFKALRASPLRALRDE
jgi:putative ABC transport system permease protein